jgi:hypothetical protein
MRYLAWVPQPGLRLDPDESDLSIWIMEFGIR